MSGDNDSDTGIEIVNTVQVKPKQNVIKFDFLMHSIKQIHSEAGMCYGSSISVL